MTRAAALSLLCVRKPQFEIGHAMDARSTIAPLAGGVDRMGARKAWTAFWQEPDAASFHCLSDAPGVADLLANTWSSLASALPHGARVLDLGCGAGAVAHALLRAGTDLHVTGVDFAKIPLVIRERVELLADTAMESLPFADASFDAAVSQFGYEYSRTAQTAKEIARVLAPGARVSFLSHHAGSAVVAGLGERLGGLLGLLSEETQTAFCAGDAHAFNARMGQLCRAHPYDPVVVKLAQALPPRLARVQRERVAIWNAIADALAPERCILETVQASCVAPEDLEEWLGPLRSVCTVRDVGALHDHTGAPIAWRIGACANSS